MRSPRKITPLNVIQVNKLGTQQGVQRNISNARNSALDETFDDSKVVIPSNLVTSKITKQTVRLSELYSAHFHFFCWDKIICFARKPSAPIICLVFCTIPVVISCIYSLQVLFYDYFSYDNSIIFCIFSREQSMQIQSRIAIYITYGLVVIFSGYFYIHLLFSDPGVLPRRVKGKDDESAIPIKLFPEEIVVLNTGRLHEELKHCETCDIYRPPRCAHCPICDCCIELLDHHCPWLNICIGRRNYRQFFSFVLFINASLIYTIVLQFTYLAQRDSIKDAFLKGLPCVIILLVLFPIGVFTVRLLIFHIILLFSNQTTREYLKLGAGVTLQTNCSINSAIYTCSKVTPPAHLDFQQSLLVSFQKTNQIDAAVPSKLVFFYQEKGKSKNNQNEQISEISHSKIERLNNEQDSDLPSNLNSAKREESSVVSHDIKESALSPVNNYINNDLKKNSSMSNSSSNSSPFSKLQREVQRAAQLQLKRKGIVMDKKGTNLNRGISRLSKINSQLNEDIKTGGDLDENEDNNSNNNNNFNGYTQQYQRRKPSFNNKSFSEAKFQGAFTTVDVPLKRQYKHSRLNSSDSNFGSNMIFTRQLNANDSPIPSFFVDHQQSIKPRGIGTAPDTQPTMSRTTTPFYPVESVFLQPEDRRQVKVFNKSNQGEENENEEEGKELYIEDTIQIRGLDNNNNLQSMPIESMQAFPMDNLFPQITDEANDSKLHYRQITTEALPNNPNTATQINHLEPGDEGQEIQNQGNAIIDMSFQDAIEPTKKDI